MIFTITLNPALDKIILVNSLIKNHNNPSTEIIHDIGGKATHVSVVLSGMGIANVATGILAGENGKQVQKLLESKKVKCDYVWQKGNETRESYIIVPKDDGGSYMITQRGFTIEEKTFEDIKYKLERLINEEDIVVISGGPPPGITPQMYEEFLLALRRKNCRLVVDVSREYLKVAIKVKPYLIKPNEVEFKEIIGRNISTEAEYINEIKKLNKAGIEVVALSLGKNGSIVGTKEKILRVYPPIIKEINDTGCGDVFLGGAVGMIEKKMPLEEVFRFATAISASKATKEGSSDFDLEEARVFSKKVKIRLIKGDY